VLLAHVGQHVTDQVYHEPPSLCSILVVWNSRSTPYIIAVNDLKSTLCALTRLCVGKKRRPEGHLRFLGDVFQSAVAFVQHYFGNSVKLLMVLIVYCD